MVAEYESRIRARFGDHTQIVWVKSNPNIHVASSARIAVITNSVTTDDQGLNAVVTQQL